jgi:aminopeptidase YwaD
MCNSTSINEINSSRNTISIFPNPANSEINIVLPSNDNTQIEITNAIGQLIIKDQNKSKIDISNLKNGLYFISVKHGQKTYTQKIIKQ